MHAPPRSDEPLTRGVALVGMRLAVLELWGQDGLRTVAARLSNEARAATIEAIVLPVSWYPSRFNVEWYEAVHHGPAARGDAALCAFVDRAIDLGFGRIRTFFLRLASLELMAARAPDMWRYEHTHGTLTVTLHPERTSALVSVQHRQFAASAIVRRGEAEGYRHILSLSGLKEVRETHALEAPDTFNVTLSWRR